MTRLKSCLIVIIPMLVIAAAGYWVYQSYFNRPERVARVIDWLRNSQRHPEWAVQAGERCGQAPFIIPSDGFIGFLWDDSFRVGHRHQGIDIFGGAAGGVTPVYAAYEGFLTRRPDWKSSLIIRIPDDPLQPGRQIWMYYTHLAGSQGDSYIVADYPPGTTEVFVTAGSLLGYQGNYSGSPGNPVGVHLHFSIVRDDGAGHFLNELEIENTLDPSPYLGLPLNATKNLDLAPVCEKGQQEHGG